MIAAVEVVKEVSVNVVGKAKIVVVVFIGVEAVMVRVGESGVRRASFFSSKLIPPRRGDRTERFLVGEGEAILTPTGIATTVGV